MSKAGGWPNGLQSSLWISHEFYISETTFFSTLIRRSVSFHAVAEPL